MNRIYKTERLLLENLTPDRVNVLKVLGFLLDNRAHFEPYEPLRNPSFYTKAFQLRTLEAEHTAFQKHSFIRFYVFKKNMPDEIIGTVSFGNIQTSPISTCSIGYKFAQNHLHHGYALEAVQHAIDVAFYHMGMQEIHAYIQTENIPSLRLVNKLNFELRNNGKRMIEVNGNWQSHYHYVLESPSTAFSSVRFP